MHIQTDYYRKLEKEISPDGAPEERVFRVGPIRPPSEAMSLLVQVTNGCTWNKCRFCDVYRHTKFRAYTVDSIKQDIDTMRWYADMIEKHRSGAKWDFDSLNAELRSFSANEKEQECYYHVANWLVNGGQTVFLQDGNTLALTASRLTEVLRYLKQTFPSIRRITSYGRAETLSKVSAEEFATLHEAGLDRIHSGYEAGSDKVLQFINKGVTSEQQITAGKNIKAGGIELSVYFMPGVGGKELSEENALGMARVVSAINPDFVRIRTAAVKPGTELKEMYDNGEFTLASEEDKLTELRTLIENVEGCTGTLASDHIINLLQYLEGSFDTDREKMIGMIDDYLSLPDIERRTFQIARRSRLVYRPSDVAKLPQEKQDYFRRIAEGCPPGVEWDEAMNGIISKYI